MIHPVKEKEHTMKSYLAIGLITVLAATAARAEVVTKGGAAGLFSAPATRSTPAAAPTGSACGACCKSEYRTVTVPTFKGTTPRTVAVEDHACSSCRTKWVASGHGKARTETSVHACGGCKG